MSTFADLSTLLLTFFVLLLSFANMDVIKFQDMQGSLKDAFGYREDNLGNFHPEMIARRTKVQSFIQQTNLGGPRKRQRQMKQMIRDLIQKQDKKTKDKELGRSRSIKMLNCGNSGATYDLREGVLVQGLEIKGSSTCTAAMPKPRRSRRPIQSRGRAA